VDVVDHASLLFEGAVDWLSVGCGFLEPIAKFFVGLLKTLAMTRAVAEGLTDDEPKAADISIHIGKTAVDSSIMRHVPGWLGHACGARVGLSPSKRHGPWRSLGCSGPGGGLVG
jgi:hypothetical protein